MLKGRQQEVVSRGEIKLLSRMVFCSLSCENSCMFGLNWYVSVAIEEGSEI